MNPTSTSSGKPGEDRWVSLRCLSGNSDILPSGGGERLPYLNSEHLKVDLQSTQNGDVKITDNLTIDGL